MVSSNKWYRQHSLPLQLLLTMPQDTLRKVRRSIAEQLQVFRSCITPCDAGVRNTEWQQMQIDFSDLWCHQHLSTQIRKWITCKDHKTGKKYYFNLELKTSSWTVPDAIVRRKKLQHKMNTARIWRRLLRKQLAGGLSAVCLFKTHTRYLVTLPFSSLSTILF